MMDCRLQSSFTLLKLSMSTSSMYMEKDCSVDLSNSQLISIQYNIQIILLHYSQRSTMNHQFNTILAQPSSQQEHPITYFNERNFFLQGLSDKYSTQIKFPNVDLKRNPKLHHYLHQYKQQRSKMQKMQNRNKSYLSSQQFSPVFADCIQQNRNKRKFIKEQQQLKHDLQKMYLQQQQIHQSPEKDQQEEEDGQQRRTILIDYKSDPIKQKQLYLLDLQIGRLQFQDKIQKQVKIKHQTCNNGALLGKMSKNILSAYMVHFDQVFACLMDQILGEQVAYLNYMQAKYRVEKSQSQYPSNEYENMKTIKMMELVKELDQLATQ